MSDEPVDIAPRLTIAVNRTLHVQNFEQILENFSGTRCRESKNRYSRQQLTKHGQFLVVRSVVVT